MTRATHRTYMINAQYKGDKPSGWDGQNWNHHIITVKNLKTGKRTSFDFWASIARPHLSTKDDILGAFRCFLDDCVCGLESFEDFCADLGYDTDSRRAEATWKACRRSAEKFKRISTDDIYDLINSLDDYA